MDVSGGKKPGLGDKNIDGKDDAEKNARDVKKEEECPLHCVLWRYVNL